MKYQAKLLLSFLLFTGMVYTARSGGPDSLEQVLQTQLPDTLRIKILGDLCFGYRQKDTAKAMRYGNEALQLSQKINYEAGIAQAWNDLGILFFDAGNYARALEYYNESLKIRQRLKDEKGKAALYLKMGLVYQTQSEYKQALQNHMKALRIYEQIGFDYGIAYALNNVANVYDNMHLNDQALEYHKRSMEMKEKMGDLSGLSGSLSNIGNLYYRQDKLEEALVYYRRAEKIQRERGDWYYLASTLNNMGQCYKTLRKYALAEKYTLEAYEIRKELDEKPGMISCMVGLAQIYLLPENNPRNPKEAVKLTEEALRLSNEVGAREHIEKLYTTLSEAWWNLGEYKKSYDSYNVGRIYHDSVFNEENTRQIAEMQAVYETEKKEQSIRLLTKDNEIRQEELDRKQTTMRIMISGFVVVSLLLLLIFRLYRQKAVANARLLVLGKEKNEFLGIAAHDLKNPLQTIMGYCQMQVEYFDKLSKEKILKYTGNIELSARRMIVLISNLLDINAIEQGTIRAKPEPIDLADFMEKAGLNFEVSSKQKDINIHTQCPPGLVLHTDHYMLSQVYENLLGNALKFSPLHSRVQVYATEKENHITISIQDAGPGITNADREKLFKKFSRLSNKPTGGESSSGLGLSIVKRLCDMMGAQVSCESEPGQGTTFHVQFKKEARA